MWSLIPSLDVFVQGLSWAFTSPSLQTHCQIFLGWIMCLGNRTEFRVFETISAGKPVSRKRRHPFDRFYNFFNRSAWTVANLACEVAVQAVTRLNPKGKLRLIVDDTLLHKSGKLVFGIGWFHDGAASTQTRVATSLGNSWVVLGLAVSVPFTDLVFCLPLHAKLRRAGKEHPGPAELARQMLQEVLAWFPDREFVLIGDGGYSSGKLLKDLDRRVSYVGLMRGDAALHSPKLARRPKSKSGPKPKYGPRIASPREKSKQADRKKSKKSSWKRIQVLAYQEERSFDVLAYEAVWPKVCGQRPIRVVLCRALDAGYNEVYLYTTDLTADAAWVVQTYAKRTSIEGAFKNSKQVMQIEKPRHWSRSSIEKLAPWVWLMQTLVTVWYLTDGRKLPEAKAARRAMGIWDTEWSFRHMCRLLRRITVRQTINAMSGRKADLRQLTKQLENYLYLAT